MLISSSAVAGPWLGLKGSRSAGPSSAFGFANSSAMVFLSFAVGQSLVIWACYQECQRQAATLSFMWSSHLLEREKKTDGYQQCGYSVVKQQIPKFMRNGEISRLSPPGLSLVMLLASLGDLRLLW